MFDCSSSLLQLDLLFYGSYPCHLELRSYQLSNKTASEMADSLTLQGKSQLLALLGDGQDITLVGVNHEQISPLSATVDLKVLSFR